MSKPRHTSIASPRRSTIDRRASGPAHELSVSDLSMVLGGQSQPDRGQELSDQYDRTVEVFVDEYLAPIGRQADAVYKLGVAAENYVRWQFEYRESRELSEERAQQLEAEEREWEEQKQREEAQERELLLQGDKPTTPAEVGQWLDASYPEYHGEYPSIPSHMVNPGPSHEPQIIIEPLDAYYY